MREHFLTSKRPGPSFGQLLLIAGGVLVITWMVGRDGNEIRSLTPNRGWSIAVDADPSSNLTFVIVRVAEGTARERHIYDDAVHAICRERIHKPICVIGFYLPNNRIPLTTSTEQWEEGTPPIVVWRTDESSSVASYTTWDCERGPMQRAPLFALCGRGVKEAYKALIGLAMHRGIGEFCQWSRREDADEVLDELLRLADELGYQPDFQRAYNEVLRAGRMRTPGYDCRSYQPKVEALLASEVATWRAAKR